MNILFIVSLTVFSISTICLTVKPQVKAPELVFGIDTETLQFPSFVSIFNQSKYICGGAILDEWRVLTAAHCFEPNLDLKYVRLVPAYTRFQPNQTEIVNKGFDVVKVCKPKEYAYDNSSSRLDFDVAVIKLKGKMNFACDLDAAKIPLEQRPNSRTALQVLGWRDIAGGRTVLQRFGVFKTKCLRASNENGTQMCLHAFAGPRAITSDSGGPVLSLQRNGDQVIYGIASGMNDDTVYTDVFKIRDLITSLMTDCPYEYDE